MSYPSLAFDTAANQALRIPELLETILQNLPQRDILLAQRVSRSFNTTISGSIRLQRALFLAPDKTLENHPASVTYTSARKPENNRLLFRAFPCSLPTVTLAIINDAPNREELASGRGGHQHSSWDVCVAFPADKAQVPAHPSASWRRMYLSQPPCRTLHLVRRWQKSAQAVIEREDGITMGELYDEVGKGKDVWPPGFVSSDRDWHFEGSVLDVRSDL